MSNNKQSSVEWLVSQLFNSGVDTTRFIKEIEQAKAMHKEEIKDAWDSAAIDATYGNKFSSPEQYYNETFNTKEK